MKEYVNRKELGDGKSYRVEINEPREFYELKDGEWIEIDDEKYKRYDRANLLYNLIDRFEDGYNKLENINGEFYEYADNGRFKINRKVEINGPMSSF